VRLIFIDEIFKVFLLIIEQEPIGHQRPLNQDKSSGLFSPLGCIPSREPKNCFIPAWHALDIQLQKKMSIIHRGA